MTRGKLALNGDTTLAGNPAIPTAAAAGSGEVSLDPSTVLQNLSTPLFVGTTTARTARPRDSSDVARESASESVSGAPNSASPSSAPEKSYRSPDIW